MPSGVSQGAPPALGAAAASVKATSAKFGIWLIAPTDPFPAFGPDHVYFIMHCSKRVGNGCKPLSELPPVPPTPKSTAAQWAPLARFIDADARLGRWAARRRATAFIY